MENVKIEDVLNILYDSCSPEMMKAIKTNIGTDMSRTRMWGRSPHSVEGIIRRIFADHYPVTARRSTLFKHAKPQDRTGPSTNST